MRVTSPVPGFSGESCGVVFVDGVADTEDVKVLGYFRRRGYGIGSSPMPAPADEEPTVAPDGEAPADEPKGKPARTASKRS